MSRLPRISGRECIDALVAAGFIVIRQNSSHVILRRDDPYVQVVVPNHKELHRGTLRAIISQAEMSVEEFLELLR